ncbi:hypothetical protein J6590_009989 [Homalodisca vitripennis]|nr:hypothetical protein J6590_009989 [Homalodisca vitripennis]
MEVEAPLDLSVTASRLKLEYCTDDSDDSDGHGPNSDPNCKAYKKSLMKRYLYFRVRLALRWQGATPRVAYNVAYYDTAVAQTGYRCKIVFSELRFLFFQHGKCE